MTKVIKKKSEDMGSRPMFKWYIWINNMHDLVKNLTEYGLYPIINERCTILAPQFSTLREYDPTDPNCILIGKTYLGSNMGVYQMVREN